MERGVSGHGRQHIEAIEFLRDYLVFYDVEYVPYKSLQLKNVNETPPAPTDVVCTECNTTIAVKTFPYAQSCSCSACGARFVYKGGGKGFVSQKKDKENDNALAIPLGSKGTLKGIEEATLKLADGSTAGLTLHTFDGTIPQLRRSLDRSLDAFFDLLPGAEDEDVEKFGE